MSRRSMMRVQPVAWIQAALLLVLAGAALVARADIWAYVDERGVAHFASQQLDDRYQLFLRAAPQLPSVPPSAGVPAAVEPAVQTVVVNPSVPAVSSTGTYSGATTGSVAPGSAWLSPRLRAFFEQSPAVMRAEPLLRDAAQRFNLDLALLKALVLAESGFDPQAVSPKGAIGLMQLMPATAQRYAFQGEAREALAGRLTDPQINVAIGARHLRELVNRYEGRIELALAAYNAGEGAVQRAGEAIPAIPETRHYVRQVMQVYEAMRMQTPARVSAPTPSLPALPAPLPPTPVPEASAPSRAASGWDAARAGGIGRRNMPAPAGAAFLPVPPIDAAIRAVSTVATEPVIEAAID